MGQPTFPYQDSKPVEQALRYKLISDINKAGGAGLVQAILQSDKLCPVVNRIERDENGNRIKKVKKGKKNASNGDSNNETVPNGVVPPDGYRITNANDMSAWTLVDLLNLVQRLQVHNLSASDDEKKSDTAVLSKIEEHYDKRRTSKGGKKAKGGKGHERGGLQGEDLRSTMKECWGFAPEKAIERGRRSRTKKRQSKTGAQQHQITSLAVNATLVSNTTPASKPIPSSAQPAVLVPTPERLPTTASHQQQQLYPFAVKQPQHFVEGSSNAPNGLVGNNVAIARLNSTPSNTYSSPYPSCATAAPQLPENSGAQTYDNLGSLTPSYHPVLGGYSTAELPSYQQHP